MANLWPWLAVAGLGALHGLNPANGWMFAAARGLRARDGTQVRRALWPIAIGHAASIAVVACAFAQGLSMNGERAADLAGALLVGFAAYRLLRGVRHCVPIGMRAGHTGLALWSFLMATAHGTGLMLVPALVPLCIGDSPARALTASGSLALALAAVGLHMAAMLGTTALVATGVRRGLAKRTRLSSDTAGHAWTAALAATGVLVLALR